MTSPRMFSTESGEGLKEGGVQVGVGSDTCVISVTEGVVVQNMSFKAGQTLIVTGVPNADSHDFAINIGNSPEELALHINPRFDAHGDQQTVVCNSYQGGSWCQEHREGGFPFNQAEEFKVRITFTSAEFVVTLPDGSEIRFPNRPGAEKYKYMYFTGDVRIHGIEIK